MLFNFSRFQVFILVLVFIISFKSQPLIAQKILSEGVKDLANQISTSVAKQQKRRIAVIPFRELDGRVTVLGTYLAEELITDLFTIGNLDIVERTMLDKILAELKLGQTGAIDPDTAKQVGKIAGVDAIVTGTVTDLQSFVALNCRLIDTQTGSIFAAAQTKIVKDDDVRKIMGMPIVTTPASEVSSREQKTKTELKAADKPQFENTVIRVTIVSVKKIGDTITLSTRLENLHDELYNLRFKDPPYLLDEDGERWRIKAVDGYAWHRQFELVPKAALITRLVFQAEAGPSGRLFNLIMRLNAWAKTLPANPFDAVINGISLD